MSLRLYNTASRTKETFVPLDPANVRLYVCGPTVYDEAHIGNARPVIVFDILFRLLRHLYGANHITYVRNITDIDDKIAARAAERGIDIRVLTEGTAKVFHEDVRALGALDPTHEPRATDTIADMIGIIERLIDRGHAYAADGHVLFSVPSMPEYGQLSRRPLDDMIAGARVEVAPYKQSETDFVLWKPSTPDLPGWDSPWGRGRPGWHIECSAMAYRYLGERFDIHGGGLDLIFPHHENEIAQTRCAFGHDAMASVWMHNGFLQVEGEKMSKSLGNFVTIRELLRGWRGRPWSGRVLRLVMMSTHYLQPIDWTQDRMEQARTDIAGFVTNTRPLSFVDRDRGAALWEGPVTPSDDLLQALEDDLNTPAAISVLKQRASRLSEKNDAERGQLLMDLRFLNVLDNKIREAHSASIFADGFRNVPPEIAAEASAIAFAMKAHVANDDIQMLNDASTQLRKIRCVRDIGPAGEVTVRYDGPPRVSVQDLVEARLAARAAKNWPESDRIRDELVAAGIVLMDNKDGTTTWEVRR